MGFISIKFLDFYRKQSHPRNWGITIKLSGRQMGYGVELLILRSNPLHKGIRWFKVILRWEDSLQIEQNRKIEQKENMIIVIKSSF